MKTFCILFFPLFLITNVLHAQWIEQGSARKLGVGFNTYVQAIKVIDAQTVWAIFSQGEAGKTQDGGATWELYKLPGVESPLRLKGLSALDANNAWVSVNNASNSAMNKLMRTTDGGSTWTTILEGPAAGFVVHFFDAQHGVVYNGPQNIQVTSNGGLNWQTPASIPVADFQPRYYVEGEYYDAVGNSIWVPAQDGKILKSADRGNTWTLQNTPLAGSTKAIRMISFSDENNGIAAGNDGINIDRLIRTVNGGTTWEEIPVSQLPVAPDPIIFIRALEAVPGLPGTYLLSVENNDFYNPNYEIYTTNNYGASWTLLSDCPKVGFAIESFDFLSPTVGWGGTGGTRTATDALFFKYTEDPYQALLTVQVDMGNQLPSSKGIHLASSKNGWSTTATPMTNTKGTIWEAALPVNEGETIQYKFINGNSWGQNEQVPTGCGIINSQGGIDRQYEHPAICRSIELDPVLFSSCMGTYSDELKPKTNTFCNPDLYLLCETFEEYSIGKLGPQSPLWISNGCDYDGTEGDACDVEVVSYWSGYTNYSGGRAMHTGTAPTEYGTYSDLDLGGLSSGKHELALKLYIPGNSIGTSLSMIIDTTQTDYVLFYTVGLYDGVVSSYRGNNLDAVDATFQYDHWMDLRFIFDQDNQKREIWLDGQQILSLDDPFSIASLDFLSFFGYSGDACIVDDIILKSIIPGNTRPANASWDNKEVRNRALAKTAADARAFAAASRTKTLNGKPLHRSTSKAHLGQTNQMKAQPGISLEIFPNPASTTVTTRYQFDQPASGVLSLVNVMGQTIKTQALPFGDQGSFTFDLNGLPAGLYTIKLNDGKEVKAQQFVKE